jgi:hypothetical protein
MLRTSIITLVKTTRVALDDLKTKYFTLNSRVSVLEEELKKVISQIDNQRSRNETKFR